MITYNGPQYIDDDGVIQRGVFLRTPYNYNRDDASNETGTACKPEEDMTQQNFKDECDINVIVERFGVTGELPQNVRQPIQEDFIEAVDYHTAQNALIAARDAFMEMPAKVRERFKNDPGEFVNFFGREENRAEAESLGLVMPRPKTEEPSKTPPAPAPTPGAE